MVPGAAYHLRQGYIALDPALGNGWPVASPVFDASILVLARGIHPTGGAGGGGILPNIRGSTAGAALVLILWER